MKVISLKQNTEEWLAWRREGIGASDIPVIMGISPYLTAYQLWEEKCGYCVHNSFNAAMHHGQESEKLARAWLEDHLNSCLIPTCIEDAQHSCFKASLDGYDPIEQVIYEIKAPFSAEKIALLSQTQEIPIEWQYQLAWQCMLADCKKAFLCVWDYQLCKCLMLPYERDLEVESQIKAQAMLFWQQVQSGTAPALTDRDYIEIDNEELKILLKEYQLWDKQAKEAEAQKKQLKERMLELGDDGNFKCANAKFTRCLPRSYYDMNQMREDGIPIDEYLVKPQGIGYYRITFSKEKKNHEHL